MSRAVEAESVPQLRVRRSIREGRLIRMFSDTEEGKPLVEEIKEVQRSSIQGKTFLAIVSLAVLAATAYASFNYGVRNGLRASVTNLSIKDSMKNSLGLEKKTWFPFTGLKEPLPNDANGPSTNDDAKKSIKHHGFEKYAYLKDKMMEGEFSSYGHGMAQDGSPIPDEPGYEGSQGAKGGVKIKVDFFNGIFKSYLHKGSLITEKLGKMEGLNSEDNIVFTDGDMLTDDQSGREDHRFGILEVLCGFEEHIVDYHVHSGYDNRITVHTPDACPIEMDVPNVCDYEGLWHGDDDHERDQYGVEWECKCEGKDEVCRCNHVQAGTSGEDMSWCAEWFNLNDFAETVDDDMDDDHEGEIQEPDKKDELPDEVIPVIQMNAGVTKQSSKLDLFNELKGDAKKSSTKFIATKLHEQKKIMRNNRGNRKFNKHKSKK